MKELSQRAWARIVDVLQYGNGRHYLWNIEGDPYYYRGQSEGNSHSSRQGGQALDPNTQELEILR